MCGAGRKIILSLAQLIFATKIQTGMPRVTTGAFCNRYVIFAYRYMHIAVHCNRNFSRRQLRRPAIRAGRSDFCFLPPPR